MKILGYRNDFAVNETRKKTDAYGGLGYYRTVKPCEKLKEKYDVTVWGRRMIDTSANPIELWTKVFNEYHVLWTRYFDKGGAISYLMGMRDHFTNDLGKTRKVVVDIDDWHLGVDESNPEYQAYAPGKSKRAVVSAMFSLADAMTVSTEPLKEAYSKYLKDVYAIDKPIFVVPNFNDVNDWNFTPAERDPNKVVIGYTGSITHNDDLTMVLPTLRKLMEKYPHVHLQLLGLVQKGKVPHFFGDWPQELRNRVDLLGATETFQEYPEWLASQAWDIGIAPLVDTAFTRAKSHIKWMEYSMYEIPTVASRVYPYFMELAGRDTIVDGETGFLCRPNEWEQKLERLILDKELRVKIGQRAKEYVKKAWQYKDSNIIETWDEILETVYPSKER